MWQRDIWANCVLALATTCTDTYLHITRREEAPSDKYTRYAGAGAAHELIVTVGGNGRATAGLGF